MIRRALEPTLKQVARQYPVVTLTGPRQSGKTTLVRAAFPEHEYASLEDPDLRSFALADPRGFLGQFSGIYLSLRVIRSAGVVHPGMVAEGLAVSLITTLLGLGILAFSALVWFGLRSRQHQLHGSASIPLEPGSPRAT